MSAFLAALRPHPVTAGLLACSLLGFLLIYLRAPLAWVSLFTFTPFELRGSSLVFREAGGEPWRLITPAFLHFNWLHIVFNGLWTWELGRRIETAVGSARLFGLFLCVAVVSNVSQYLFGGPGLFGGMSGVVYGFLGFAWLGERLNGSWRMAPPPGVMAFMLGWLVICELGVIEVLGFGAIANAAHVGGLLAGLLLALPLAALARR